MNENNEDAVIRKRNERVSIENAANSKTAPVPAAPDDIQAVIDAYNETERIQYERLAQIWAFMAERRGSARYIRFSNGTRWTTNDFRPDPGRPDILMGRSLESFSAEVLDYDIGT